MKFFNCNIQLKILILRQKKSDVYVLFVIPNDIL